MLGLAIVVYLIGMLIARNKKPNIPVWSVMSFAMFISIAGGLVSIDEIDSFINLDVILFLIGMFSLVSILEYSGVIDYLAIWFVTKFRSRYTVLFALSLSYGLLSAFTVNDALTVMGTPLALTVSKVLGIEPKTILLLIAFSITIGSVMTPVGNPQNMLISSSSGMSMPFVKFISVLTIPTLINLVLTTIILIKLHRIRNSEVFVGLIPSEAIKDKREALIGVVLFTVTIIGFIINDIFEMLGLIHVEKRGLIPFVTASIAYIVSKNPRRIVSSISWGTILFFISMFVVMNSVWRSGVLQPVLTTLLPGKTSGLDTVLRISLSSILLSQLLSNVPFTSLYIEYLKSLGYCGLETSVWLTLAFASTIAGNLTLLGAASNIILLEVAEQRDKRVLGFIDFFKTGSIVTIVNALLYIPFVTLLAI